MSIFHRFLSISVFIVALVGCAAPDSTNDSALITPQFSQPTTTAGNLENSSTTITLPTSTSKPNATPDITQTAIAQEINSAQFAEQTLIAPYPRACKNLYFPREFSPNGSWMAESCYSEIDESLILTLSNRESQVLWKLVYRDYIQQGNVLPDGGLAVVYWSNDGRYAYFNSFVSGSGGECFVNGNVLNYGKGLFRLDLATGYSTTILPLKENFTGYDFSFSSTGRRLVYETHLSGVKVLDLKTGEVITVSSMNEFNGAGGFLWSPDGLQFVYSTVMPINYGENNKYSLRFVDAQLGIEQIIFESQENCFFTKLWSADNILTIENYDKNYNRTLVDFDLNTNTVISETNSP